MESKVILSLPPDVIENILGFVTYCATCKVIGQERKFRFNHTWCSLYKCVGCGLLLCNFCDHEDLVRCSHRFVCGGGFHGFCPRRAQQWFENAVAWYMMKLKVWDSEGNVLYAIDKRTLSEVLAYVRAQADITYSRHNDLHRHLYYLISVYREKYKKERYWTFCRSM